MLRDLLKKQLIAGVEIVDGQICLSVIRRGLTNSEILISTCIPINSDSWQTVLENYFASENLKIDEIICMIRRNDTVVHSQKLPFIDQAKVRKVLPIASEEYLPFKRGEAVLNFSLVEQFPDDSGIFEVYAVKNSKIEKIKEDFSKFSLKEIYHDFHLIFEALPKDIRDYSKGVSLLLIKDKNEILSLAVSKGKFLFSRRDAWAGEEDDVHKIIDSYKIRFGTENINSIKICRFNAEEIELIKNVSDNKQEFTTFNLQFQEKEEFWACLLAFVHSKNNSLKLNFFIVSDREVLERDVAFARKFTVAMALIALITYSFNIYFLCYVKEEKVKKLVFKQNMLLKSSFPNIRKAVKPLYTMEKSVQKLKDNYQFNQSSRTLKLDVLKELTERIKERENASVQTVSLDREKVILKGETDSFKTYEKLKEELYGATFFDKIIKEDSKTVKYRNEQKVRFELRIQLKTI